MLHLKDFLCRIWTLGAKPEKGNVPQIIFSFAFSSISFILGSKLLRSNVCQMGVGSYLDIPFQGSRLFVVLFLGTESQTLAKVIDKALNTIIC